MNFNSKNINKALDNLNRYLHSGYLLKIKWKEKYEKKSKKKDFNFEAFHAKYITEANTWIIAVNQYLEKRFEKHYSFHFIQTRPDATDALTYAHPVDRIVKGFIKHLFALEDIIIRVEERRNLAVRQEIAEKEYQVDILYKVTYSNHTREVKLNNIVLTKTDFNSENDNCFQYIYANPDRPIGIKELEQEAGNKLKKRLAHIVRDLGFVKELKTIFFPVVTKNQVMFKNPITKQYAHKHNLSPINFKKIGRQSKTE